MTANPRLDAYINQELNRLVENKYSDEEIYQAVLYQKGFLTSVVTELCHRDSYNLDLFRRALIRADQRRQQKQ